MKRIAIVGGGTSGLITSLQIERKSSERLDITIFEAEGRLGGKVLTRQFQTAPILYEAGVAELYRYGNDPLWRLVTRLLGLTAVEMSGSTVVFEDRVLRREQDLGRYFGAKTANAFKEFQRRGRAARPFCDFYAAGCPADNLHPWMNLSLRDLLAEVPDDTARRFIEVLIHSDLATEPHLTHGLYGIDNYLVSESDYCQLYSIKGGITRLIDALAQKVSARVTLNAPVQCIGRTATGSYLVAYDHDGRAESAEFDAVVVALPIYALRQLHWGGRRLLNAIRSYVTSYEDSAHYLRITALFREPFWKGSFDESWFIHDAFGGCCIYDEGTRHEAGPCGVLSWLLAGSDALAMSRWSDEQIIKRVIDSMPAGIADAAVAQNQLIEGHVNRWIGMVYGMPGGRPIKGIRQRHSPEPKEHSGLILTGDYLYDSTINGAFDSAAIAARILLDHLGI